ncbi:hypothetical protein COO60DRAFT_1642910 [Scenedesmus sp. NREL 46B-D3]|nr:hypothetical protein COO60DRAFT_1642910 [Scenedesmus sp. NREL 46B-D3]
MPVLKLHKVDPASCPGPDVFRQHDTFKLRWFTPAAEVPLCGHATLASAATLFTASGNPAPTLHFETLSGTLSVTRKQDGQRELLQMSLPSSAAADPLPAQLQPPASCTPAAAAAAAGKVDPADADGCSRTAFSQLFAEKAKGAWLSSVVRHVGYVSALKYLLVVLQPDLQLGRQGLQALQPDIEQLQAAAAPDHLGGIIVSTLASQGEAGGYDFHSRFFAPWLGVEEDPVTGSAHAVLGPYYAALLRKQQLCARQCSARGGDVWMDLAAQPGRVVVSGEAVIQQTWDAEY